jgi:hypothetical protein
MRSSVYLHQGEQFFFESQSPLFTVPWAGFGFQQWNTRESFLRHFVNHLKERSIESSLWNDDMGALSEERSELLVFCRFKKI